MLLSDFNDTLDYKHETIPGRKIDILEKEHEQSSSSLSPKGRGVFTSPFSEKQTTIEKFIMPDAKFFKVLSTNWTHNNFKYKYGLNVLEGKFNDDPTQSCCSGRLYITTQEHLRNYLHYGTQIAQIEFPTDNPDFKIIKDPHPQGDKWGVNMLVIKKVYSMYELETYFELGLDIKDCYRELSNKGKEKYDNFLELYNKLKRLARSPDNLGLRIAYDYYRESNSKCLEGDIKFLQEAHDNGRDLFFRKDVLDNSFGNPKMIKWLCENGYINLNISYDRKKCNDKSIQCISCIICDHIDEYCFLHFDDLENIFSEKQLYRKICSSCPTSKYIDNDDGRLDIIEVLDNIISSGVKFEYTKNAMNNASINERTDVLEWWKHSGIPLKFTKSVVLNVKSKKVVDWWMSSGLIKN